MRTSLCFRCEHRARFLEGNGRPRYECGEVGKSKMSCYMFLPIKPVIMERLYSEKEDPRPEYGMLLGCRMKVVRVTNDDEVELAAFRKDDGTSYIMWKKKED